MSDFLQLIESIWFTDLTCGFSPVCYRVSTLTQGGQPASICPCYRIWHRTEEGAGPLQRFPVYIL